MEQHGGAHPAPAYESPTLAVGRVRWAVGLAVWAAALSGTTGLVLAAVLGWAGNMTPAGMRTDVASPAVSAGVIGLLGTIGMAVLVAGLITVGAMLAGAVTVIRWQSVALRNLPALEAGRARLSVGAAAAAWFVPVWGLIGPRQVLADLWRSGESAGADREATVRRGPLPAQLTAWWAAWIGADLLSAVLWVVPERFHTLGAMALTALIMAVLNGVLILGGVLLVRVLRQISRRQDARFRALSRSPTR